ncbi:unnamed protein product [Prorocentrum cordatum]|uniref:B box-type domain-containing protein n=1 Tax=Prorocentrum cordatum TaxID=2364126 RepID=A0ABN9V3J4_9DINO|nr:unnamed protein product [Polarella glacialis]
MSAAPLGQPAPQAGRPGADAACVAGAGPDAPPGAAAPPCEGAAAGGSVPGQPWARPPAEERLEDVGLAAMMSVDGTAIYTSCAICNKSFPDTDKLEGRHEVKLLPCFHCVCGPCLQSALDTHAGDVNFACPLCRKSSLKKSLHEYLPHFEVHSEIDKAQVAQRDFCCEECVSGNRAEVYCSHCVMNLCGMCARQHGRAKATARHELSSLCEEDSSGRVVRVHRAQFCASHRRSRYELFCETCDTVICRECAMTSHQSHNYKLPSASLVERHRRGIQDLVDSLNSGLLSAQECHREINRSCEATAATVQKAKASADRDFDELLRAAEARCAELALGLLSGCRGVRAGLEAEKSRCSAALVDLWRTIDFLEKVLSRGTDVEVLQMKWLFKETRQLRLMEQWASLASESSISLSCPDLEAGWRSVAERDALLGCISSFGSCASLRPAFREGARSWDAADPEAEALPAAIVAPAAPAALAAPAVAAAAP